ncbi:thiol-disulfide oxidoreductase DCC family protein [Halomonas beimenensis]|uniref:Putative thiol-disulfide oxidoreductase YuxK, DCC family n=1 Tax=Halomonas beimenensis TaxID=475662 RepID=A0A291P4D2_9GAMM|nr:DUF393 domain-containing protein [Halomonas beimenensis]ATJ81712.1 putative thiol-disulfide oxidoreductase YuxK, DCC family [Halomonas beimenensis]
MSRFAPLEAASPVTLFHDGECPFCRCEVAWLRRHPRADRLVLVDIRASGFEAAAWGRTFEAMRGRLHVRDAAGRWFVGMEASRALYAVLGHRRLVWWSCLPGVAGLLDGGYRIFARHRERLGRRVSGRRR